MSYSTTCGVLWTTLVTVTHLTSKTAVTYTHCASRRSVPTVAVRPGLPCQPGALLRCQER